MTQHDTTQPGGHERPIAGKIQRFPLGGCPTYFRHGRALQSPRWPDCGYLLRAMHSQLRAALVMVSLGAGLLACSRSVSDSTKSVVFPGKPATNTSAVDWQVKCDANCDVQAKGATLDALCAATVEAIHASAKTTCTARRAVGFPQLSASAVSDAAIVEISTSGKVERTAFLALKGAKTWQLARPLGTASSIKTISASPVDVPGLAPAGVQLSIALTDESSSRERMFVCGLTGDGATKCPVAIEVAGSKTDLMQMTANAAGALNNEWRVAVELTPKGFVAKKVAGSVPDGLAGEHGFVTQ